VKIWASWSDRPFVVCCWYCSCYSILPCGCSHIGDMEDRFILPLSTNILSMAVLELFWIFVAKFTVCDTLYVVNNEIGCFFGCFQWGKMCLCHHKLKFMLEVYTAVSRHHVSFFIYWLISHVGTLYKFSIINLDDLVTSLTAQISKSFSLQLCEILILLKYGFFNIFLSTIWKFC